MKDVVKGTALAVSTGGSTEPSHAPLRKLLAMEVQELEVGKRRRQAAAALRATEPATSPVKSGYER